VRLFKSTKNIPSLIFYEQLRNYCFPSQLLISERLFHLVSGKALVIIIQQARQNFFEQKEKMSVERRARKRSPGGYVDDFFQHDRQFKWTFIETGISALGKTTVIWREPWHID